MKELRLKRMVRSYKRKTTNKNWSKTAMAEAVATVLEGKMGYSLASRTFSLPKTTLERWVKKARAFADSLPPQHQEKIPEEFRSVDSTGAMCVKHELDDEESEWIIGHENKNKSFNSNATTATRPASPCEITTTTNKMAQSNKGNVPQTNKKFHTEGFPFSNLDADIGTYFNSSAQFCEYNANNPLPNTTAHHQLGGNQSHQYQCHHHHHQQSLDDVEQLFLGFAKTIKTFSPRRQVLTKMHIAKYILEQELQQRDEEEKHHL